MMQTAMRTAASPDPMLEATDPIGVAPETVLPAQFFTGPCVDASRQGEKRLMLAVLADAIGILYRGAGRNVATAGLARETRRWLVSRDTTWPYSFTNICLALGLDAQSLRAAVLTTCHAVPPRVDRSRVHPLPPRSHGRPGDEVDREGTLRRSA